MKWRFSETGHGSPSGLGPVEGLVRWASRLDAGRAWWLSLTLLLVVGVLDALTGVDIWMGPFYLLALCVPAWCLGFVPSAALAVVCVAASVAINGGNAYPVGQTAVVWNGLMRVMMVFMMIGLIVALRRSHDRYVDQASRDQLTGALNRRAFKEAGGATRAPGWRLLAYLDLDGFKQINDRFGHAAGDATLKAFTRALQGELRSTDCLARLGGDEFLLLLDVQDEAGGHRAVESLRARTATFDLPYAARCSIGALVLPPQAGPVTEAHISAADALMYEAKRARLPYQVGVAREGGRDAPAASSSDRFLACAA